MIIINTIKSIIRMVRVRITHIYIRVWMNKDILIIFYTWKTTNKLTKKKNTIKKNIFVINKQKIWYVFSAFLQRVLTIKRWGLNSPLFFSPQKTVTAVKHFPAFFACDCKFKSFSFFFFLVLMLYDLYF